MNTIIGTLAFLFGVCFRVTLEFIPKFLINIVYIQKIYEIESSGKNIPKTAFSVLIWRLIDYLNGTDTSDDLSVQV